MRTRNPPPPLPPSSVSTLWMPPYHVGKKVADVGFVWYLDTLFQPTIFRLENLSLVENTVKHIHFQDNKQEINVL